MASSSTTDVGNPANISVHPCPGVSTAEAVQVPIVLDTMTFESRQAVGLRDMEKRIEADMKRKRKSWEKEVERMRQEFLLLYPTDRVWGSEELLNDPMVAKRRGSTDILDPKKMKTLFLDYPDVGRKFRVRFDATGFDPASIHVASEGDRIVVRANKTEPALSQDPGKQEQKLQNDKAASSSTASDKLNADGTPICSTDSSTPSGPTATGTTVVRAYERKIQKPKEVDPSKFKSYLTSDHILIVEAPLRGRSSYHDLRRASPASSTHHSAIGLSSSPAGSRSPSNSPGDTPSKDNKIGVPTFRDEGGQRKLVLVVDMGGIFKPQDITVQVIKDNKIWIWAKHEEKTTERLTKSKFSKEYELGEKIETHSLTGVLTPDGRLTVGAYAKGHGAADGMTTSKSDDDKHSTGGGRKSVDGLKQTQSCVGLVQST